jgi:hypothetical protein
MSRDRYGEEDDYRDDHPSRPRPSTNPALIVGLILGGVVLGVLVCGGLFAMMAFRGGGAQVPQAQVADETTVDVGPENEVDINPLGGKEGDATKVYSRDEFKRLVLGKSPEEVIAAVGRPASFHNEDDEPIRWHYSQRALNPATGKADSAWVEFVDRKVIRVSW